MSSIDRLLIQGVRAFGADYSERIDFSVPLTLIVGHNGSGKTTIIESLKYASTGMMPPGLHAKGDPSFLHDPKLDSESTMTARIQMVMHGANGAKITATRQMEVNRVKNKSSNYSFNAKSHNLLVEGQGGARSASVTQLEMNTSMPSYLGVSSHVLDLVIFCHQDDSLWPLSDSTLLKAKFDKLFEIDKWVKCYAQMEKMKKEYQGKLKEHKVEEQHYKTEKDRGARLLRECDALKNEIEALEANRIAMQDEYEAARAGYDQAEQNLNHAKQIVDILVRKTENLASTRRMLELGQQGLTELDESTKDLEEMLASYKERVDRYDESRNELRGQYEQLRHGLERHSASLKNAERDIGAHEAQHKNHEVQKGERQQLIKSLATRHDISGYSGPLDDGKAGSFRERLQRMVQETSAEVDSVKQSSKDEVQGIRQRLNDIARQQTTQLNKKDSANSAIHQNDTKVAQLQQEYDKLDVDEGDLAVIQTQLTDVKRRLTEAKTEMQTANYVGQEGTAKDEMAKIKKFKQGLEEELKKAIENSKQTAQVDNLREKITVGQQRLSTMLSAHKDRLGSVIGEQWQTSELQKLYLGATAGASTALSEAKKQRDNASRELEQLDEKLSACMSKTDEHEAKVATALSAINAVVEAGPEGYHEEVEQLEAARDATKKQAGEFQLIIDYLDQCQKDAETKKACRTCTRPLKSNEIEVSIKNIAREKSRLDKTSADADVAQVEKELKEVKAVAAQVVLWDRLSNVELPALREEKRRLDQQHATIRQTLDAHEGLVADRTTALRDVESVGKTVEKIAQLHTDLSRDEKELQDLNAKLAAIDQHRDLKSIQGERDSLERDESVAQTTLDKLRSDRGDAEKKITDLEFQARDKEKEMLRIEADAREKREKSKAIDDLKVLSLLHKTTVRECDRELKQLQLEHDAAQEKLDDASMRGDAIEKELQQKAHGLQDSLNKLNHLQSQIQGYLDDDGPGRMERAHANKRTIEEKAAGLQREQAEVMQELAQVDTKARDHEAIRNNIEKNLTCRATKAEIVQLENEIEELSNRDPETEKEKYEHARQMWEKEKQTLNDQLIRQDATTTQKVFQLEEKEATFKKEYKDAALNYRKAHIYAEVTIAVAKDLAQYGAAMDQAMMKFHSLKMDEINRIIDELWRKTYQGSDIDTIFIVSDAEKERKGTGSSKSYHYRVCMQKMNTAMDMRGRCSAGQKVLACIIIRLALAECFGVNCGLIALDEPTTNLDRDNIQALALSLAELIKLRRAQKNFQLIVITHDEEFLKFMNPANYVDHYWRVSRTNRQKSHIQQEQISYLMRH